MEERGAGKQDVEEESKDYCFWMYCFCNLKHVYQHFGRITCLQSRRKIETVRSTRLYGVIYKRHSIVSAMGTSQKNNLFYIWSVQRERYTMVDQKIGIRCPRASTPDSGSIYPVGMKLNPHLHPMSRLRIHGAASSLIHTPSWRSV